MSQYSSITGTILQIDWQSTDPQQIGCVLRLTVNTQEQGIVNMTVDGSAFVLNSWPMNVGDQVTLFYDNQAPAPLIYPPLYQTIAAAHTPSGSFAALDVFTQSSDGSYLSNSDDSLRLTPSSNTWMTLPNGQPFGGSLSGKLLLVLYSATTRSIPPQTTPEQIVVFCGRMESGTGSEMNPETGMESGTGSGAGAGTCPCRRM